VKRNDSKWKNGGRTSPTSENGIAQGSHGLDESAPHSRQRDDVSRYLESAKTILIWTAWQEPLTAFSRFARCGRASNRIFDYDEHYIQKKARHRLQAHYPMIWQLWFSYDVGCVGQTEAPYPSYHDFGEAMLQV
jgi:hypothetical protein